MRNFRNFIYTQQINFSTNAFKSTPFGSITGRHIGREQPLRKSMSHPLWLEFINFEIIVYLYKPWSASSLSSEDGDDETGGPVWSRKMIYFEHSDQNQPSKESSLSCRSNSLITAAMPSISKRIR